MNFHKYQSLGNDFILLDWLDRKDEEIKNIIETPGWPLFINDICARHTGIGADGVLIIKQNTYPEILIFNADGSNGNKCLNGLRCAAHYLHNKKSYAANFSVIMNHETISCAINSTQNTITINAGKANYLGQHSISIAKQNLSGHIIDMGNPHFVIPQKVDFNWLKEHGAKIENHTLFPNRTNVEFIWQNDENSKLQKYDVLVHERGVGITQACGSGAAAIMQTLYSENKIKINEKVLINMQGGIIESYFTDDKEIIQTTTASYIYAGVDVRH